MEMKTVSAAADWRDGAGSISLFVTDEGLALGVFSRQTGMVKNLPPSVARELAHKLLELADAAEGEMNG